MLVPESVTDTGRLLSNFDLIIILVNTTTTVRVTIGKSLEKTNLSANITLKVEPTGQKEVRTWHIAMLYFSVLGMSSWATN